jgi:hypothetical protein
MHVRRSALIRPLTGSLEVTIPAQDVEAVALGRMARKDMRRATFWIYVMCAGAVIMLLGVVAVFTVPDLATLLVWMGAAVTIPSAYRTVAHQRRARAKCQLIMELRERSPPQADG